MFPTRRDFLRTSLAAAAGFANLSAPGEAISSENFPAVDCHTHFYDPTRPEGVPWPGKDDRLLYRPVLPKHFLEQGAPLGVAKTVVVEASPRVEDNAWLLQLAAENKSIVGVVGNLAAGQPSFAEQLKRFAGNKLFRGIRIGHDALQKGIDRPEFLADIRRLAENELELDINGGPTMPLDVARLAEKIPNLTIVINHLANQPIDGKSPPAAWVNAMRTAAKQSTVFCKVSALVESAKPRGDGAAKRAPVDVDFYRLTLDAIWEIFGDDRLIFGSNWPVSNIAATYSDLFTIVRQFTLGRGRACSDKFFWKNSEKAYRYPV